MIKSTINEIFRNADCHSDSAKIVASDSGAHRLLEEKSAALEILLPAECHDAHTEFVDALESVHAEEAERYFAEGFKMGLRLGLELDG